MQEYIYSPSSNDSSVAKELILDAKKKLSEKMSEITK
jgi:hypothetical protein